MSPRVLQAVDGNTTSQKPPRLCGGGSANPYSAGLLLEAMRSAHATGNSVKSLLCIRSRPLTS